jgi:hypothetical protein
MFSSSPSFKHAVSAFLNLKTKCGNRNCTDNPPDNIGDWCRHNNFRFPPQFRINDPVMLLRNTPTFEDIALITESLLDGGYCEFNERGFRPTLITGIFVGHIDHILLSQYNPWLDCDDGISDETVSSKQKRLYFKPKMGDVCFPVQSNILGGETSIDFANLYLWPLLHSRADDVIACRTFGHWKRLFYSTIHLAFPSYHEWNDHSDAKYVALWDKHRFSILVKHVNPARALFLISTKSNFWPYGRRGEFSGSSIWTVWPTSIPKSKSSLSSLSSATSLFSISGTGSGRTNRSSTGLCSVKKLKEHGDDAKIEWMVSSDFLRNMKRVHIYLEPSRRTNADIIEQNDTDSDE